MEMRRLLKPTGSIYLHCDQTMSHSIKLLMDVVFGGGNFRNEIIWCYPPGGKGPRFGFHRKHDAVFFYGKSENRGVFNRPYSPITESAKAKFTSVETESGRRYKRYPGGKTYLDESKGRPVPNWWTDINSLGQTVSKERTGYPTQKPIALLERIIKASSGEGDLVLDPFCGCATTCVAAERLGRHWIGIDIGLARRQPCQKAADRRNRPRQTRRKSARCASPRLQQRRMPDADGLGRKSGAKELRKLSTGSRKAGAIFAAAILRCNIFTLTTLSPRRKGGPDTNRNLQLLCSACNIVKSTRTMENAKKRLRELGYMSAPAPQ